MKPILAEIEVISGKYQGNALAEINNIQFSALRLLIQSYVRRSMVQEALEPAKQALHCAEIAEDLQKQGEIINLLGIIFAKLSKYSTALEYFVQSLEIAKKLGNTQMCAVQYGNIGIAYKHLGDFYEALDAYKHALEIDEQYQNREGVANHFVNLSNIYYELQDFESCSEYAHKALETYRELGNEAGMATAYINISTAFQGQNDFETAIEYLKKSQEISLKIGNFADVALTEGNIGTSLLHLGRYEEAHNILLQALAGHEKYKNDELYTQVLVHLSKVLSKKEYVGYNPIRAEEYLLQALAQSRENNLKVEERYVLSELSSLYKELQRWEEAVHALEQYYKVERELESIEVQKQAERFDAERKIFEHEQQRIRAEYAAEHAKDQAEIYRLKSVELATALDEVRKLNESLSAAITEKNEIMGIVVHDLKNPLNAILMIAKILRNDSVSNVELQEFSDDIISTAQRMFTLITDLLIANAHDQEQLKLVREPVDISEKAKILSRQFSPHATEKSLEIVAKIQENVVASGDDNAVLSIMENLISNAVKYSPYGKKVFISVEKLG